MGFRSDWEAATAAANNPNSELHDAGVAYTNALNDYIASADTGTYDVSNKSIPEKPHSWGYYKEANKLADYAIENGNSGWRDNGQSPDTRWGSSNDRASNSSAINYGGNSDDNGRRSSGGNGEVYGTPRYGGRTENPNVTGTEWRQPGTGFGTGSFLGMALEDINAQNQTAAPTRNTGYAGQNVMVPDGGNRASNSTGTEWNQPGTGFGTGNFAGDYRDMLELIRGGSTPEEAADILANGGPVYGTPRYGGVTEPSEIPRGTEWRRPGTGFGTGNFAGDYRDMLALIQGGQAQPTVQTQATSQNSLSDESRRAFKDYQVAGGPNYNGTSAPKWVPVEAEVNTSQPIDVWAYNRAVADRQRGLNIDQILLAAEDEGSPQSMQYYNWIVNHMK